MKTRGRKWMWARMYCICSCCCCLYFFIFAFEQKQTQKQTIDTHTQKIPKPKPTHREPGHRMTQRNFKNRCSCCLDVMWIGLPCCVYIHVLFAIYYYSWYYPNESLDHFNYFFLFIQIPKLVNVDLNNFARNVISKGQFSVLVFIFSLTKSCFYFHRHRFSAIFFVCWYCCMCLFLIPIICVHSASIYCFAMIL